MAKPSLLQIVQEIANDLDTDEINSISDTPESVQIANIVASTYRAIMSNRDWPHTARLIRINSSASSIRPNIMTFDENFKKLISVFYNKAKLGETRVRYEEVKWIDPDDMLRVFYNRNTDADHIVKIDGGGGQVFVIENNKAPTYYTSFDDNTLVFDSYDISVDSVLQSSKTQARAYVIPSITLSDNHIPDLPEEAFSFLIEEAKSKASMKLAQKVDQKSEQESKRQNQWLSRNARRTQGGIKFIRYGKGSSHRVDPTFKQDK